MNRPSDTALPSPRRLDGIKRRIYVAALSIAGTAAALGYLMHDGQELPAWARLTFGPGIVVMSVIFAVALGSRQVPLRAVERLSFVFVAVFLYMRIVLTLFHESHTQPLHEVITSFSPWMASVFIFAFVALPTRNALPAALVIYFILLGTAVAFAVDRGFSELAVPERNYLVQEFGVANAFTITMLYFLSRTKEALSLERTERLVMARLAHTDELTQIPNRRFILQQLQKAYDRAQREGSRLSVVLFDLDRFKNINDTLGHATGDEVLRRVATLARERLRSGDEIGRFGGEEFLVVAFGADEVAAAALGERLRVAFADDVRPGEPSFTATFGVAEARAGENVAALLARSDAALYAGKQQGRNRVVRASAAEERTEHTPEPDSRTSVPPERPL